MADLALIRGIIDNTHPDIEWKRLARAGSLIEAIKDVRRLYDCGLKDAKDTVQFYLDEIRTAVDGLTGVKTTIVNIPGGTLSIVDNGRSATILYTRTMASDVYPSRLAQAIADAAVQATMNPFNRE